MAEKATIVKLKLNAKKETLTVGFQKTEVMKKGRIFDTEWTKTSNQPMSMALHNIFRSLQPHLLYANELAGVDIKLDQELDARSFFNDFKFEEVQLFKGLQVTAVDFIRNDSVIDGVIITGYRETQLTDKGFKVPLTTGPIMFERSSPNKYPLLFVLEEQIDDLETCSTNWLEKGDTNDLKEPIRIAAPEAEADRPF